jgi:ABC-type xylose transport system permease subunit
MSVHAAAVSNRRTPRRFSAGLDRFGGVYLWLVFIVVFGVWTPSQFLTTSTLHAVASQQAVTGMIALAILIPLSAGFYDLSVGATANVTGILAVVLMNNDHFAVLPAVLVAIGIAVLIGVINAFIVVRLGVNSFIGTLGMGSILSAVQVIISSNSQPLPPTSLAWNDLTQRTIGGFQIVVLYLLVLALLLWWLQAHHRSAATSTRSAATPRRHVSPACASIGGQRYLSSCRRRWRVSPGCSSPRRTGHRSTSVQRCCCRRSPLRSSDRPSSGRGGSTSGERYLRSTCWRRACRASSSSPARAG